MAVAMGASPLLDSDCVCYTATSALRHRYATGIGGGQVTVNYIYLVEQSTGVPNEWVPVRAFANEKFADDVVKGLNINTHGWVYSVAEVELIT